MYLQYYHLSRKPFQIDTGTDFLWLGEKHREALATLKYGLLENKGLLLLTGDVGVGKTTVVNALLANLEDSDVAAAVHDPGLEPIDFFNFVAVALGLSGGFQTKGAFLAEFTSFLHRCYYEGRRVLLIIDECHLISDDLLKEVRLFSNLEKGGRKLINVFLVGQLELNDLLMKPENRAIRQRISAYYNIEPLSVKETEIYIRHRLTVAGARREIFDKKAIREIHHFAAGYPRLINIIADRALLTGFVVSSRHISKKTIRECARELDLIRTHMPKSSGSKKSAKDRISAASGLNIRYKYLACLAVLLIAGGVLYYLFADRIQPGLEFFADEIRTFLD